MGTRVWGVALLAMAAAAACSRGAAPSSSTPPAKVASPVSETALTTITLTPEAQKRLGIETAKTERRTVVRTRTVGGEVVPAGGAQMTVTAPTAGTLGGDSRIPAVGAFVEKGQVLMTLVPLAPAERDVRIEAERAAAEAQGRYDMAAKRAERAKQLVKDGSGSQRAAEEAQADLVAAEAAWKAAKDRLALASQQVSASGSLPLAAPRSAMLRAVHATPGQTVGAGSPLFDLVTLDTVWLRVPVYAGDVTMIDRRAPAEVTILGAGSSDNSVNAMPIAAPPAADATTAGVDLFYSIVNRGRAFAPGERVTVRLPLSAREESLVVPRSAVLYDALGGTWVYEARDNGVFVRQRISLADVAGETAVLQHGPAPGLRVVTVGAAELFGTEFGVGK